MPRWFRSVLLPLASLLWAPAALAQLMVATDHPSYFVGETVHISIWNAGPHAATFTSSPGHLILDVDTGECLDGCVGLPVLWDLPPGGAFQVVRDTGALPDPVGRYEVALSAWSVDPGSVLSVRYDLFAPVSTAPVTWGAVKSLFR